MAQKSVIKNAFLNTLRTVLSLIIPFITFPYSTRVIMADNLGKVQFSTSIVSYFGVIAALGLGSYGVREIAKVRDDKIALNKTIRELLIINIISTIVAYGLLTITVLLVPKFYEFRFLIFICSINIFFTTIGMEWIYAGLEEYVYITIRSVIIQILGVAALFIFVKTKEDYIKYAFINIISCVGSSVFNFVHAFKYIDLKLKVKLDIKKHLKPLFLLFAYSITSSIFTLLDTSMLGFLTNTEQVGYYSAAVKIVRMIRDLFPAAFVVVFPRLTYLYAQNSIEEYNSLIKKILNLLCCFALPMSVGLFIIIDIVLILFCGISYTPAVPVAVVLCPLIFCSTISGFLGGGVLISQNKDKTYLSIIIAATVIAITTNLIFIPLKQAVGAALATTITEAFIVIIYFIYFFKLLLKINFFKDILQYILGTAVMGICVYITHKFINNDIINIIISIITGMISYGLVLIICKNPYLADIKNFIAKKFLKKQR